MTAAPQRAAAAEPYYWELVPSPLGAIIVTVDAEGCLTEIRLDGEERSGPRDARRCAAACRQLAEYFAGKRRDFDLPLAPRGTAFQQRVWQALRAIPFGVVRTYGHIARDIGQPLAVRAVGQANGRNPLPIVVPCHRVIAGDGTIGGYSGGLNVKHKLLALEGIELKL
ncbi:MAG TPA: methylated-DNA--[protein]-cysteine S-methyltransferase [Gammaproteobacteria bacterium]|jgi:methylated-DNA-[protein]-cysteine S-methyltransferase|nr:methylated-DNA--[protein]-cysteine S-methyltransferase [Gammaproteobacteria bacterium]